MSNYASEKIAQAEAQEDSAFHALMDLLRDAGVPSHVRSEVITLWVQGTSAWSDKGWHTGWQSAQERYATA
jgi:hypothetical protein